MRVKIIAVSRMKAGPELALMQTYLERARGIGRGLGFSAFDVIEVEGKPLAEPRAEASALFKATPDQALCILLDERGENWSSRQIAEKLTGFRDEGVGDLVFWIGGADGAAQSLKDQADAKLSFGRQTWPHKLVRVLLTEQLYRALTILSGNPYHRDEPRQ
jgi:23S rRNA (pseudouridine1915-N3)-methyltransferase